MENESIEYNQSPTNIAQSIEHFVNTEGAVIPATVNTLESLYYAKSTKSTWSKGKAGGNVEALSRHIEARAEEVAAFTETIGAILGQPGLIFSKSEFTNLCSNSVFGNIAQTLLWQVDGKALRYTNEHDFSDIDDKKVELTDDAIIRVIPQQNNRFVRRYLGNTENGLVMKEERLMSEEEEARWVELFMDYNINLTDTPHRLEAVSLDVIREISNPLLLELFLSRTNPDKIISTALENQHIGHTRLHEMYSLYSGIPQLSFGMALNPLIYDVESRFIRKALARKSDPIISGLLIANKGYTGKFRADIFRRLLDFELKTDLFYQAKLNGTQSYASRMLSDYISHAGVTDKSIITAMTSIIKQSTFEMLHIICSFPTSFWEKLGDKITLDLHAQIINDLGSAINIYTEQTNLGVRQLGLVLERIRDEDIKLKFKEVLDVLHSKDPDQTLPASESQLCMIARLSDSPQLLKRIILNHPDTKQQLVAISNLTMSDEDLEELVIDADFKLIHNIIRGINKRSRIGIPLRFALQQRLRALNIEENVLTEIKSLAFEYSPVSFNDSDLERIFLGADLNLNDKKTIAQSISYHSYIFTSYPLEDEVFEIFYRRYKQGEILTAVTTQPIFIDELLSEHQKRLVYSYPPGIRKFIHSLMKKLGLSLP